MNKRQSAGHGISLLVPFTPGLNTGRDRLWDWLHQYWRAQLPRAEIVMGRDPDPGVTFSKSAAVNEAASRAHGDVLVILDADAYLSAELIVYCAMEIRRARRYQRKLWFIPYRRFYRVSSEITQRVLSSDPKKPWRVDDPPAQGDLDPSHGHSPKFAHHYAAMIMILPREAFAEAGGMDPRFVGWGGEDISFMRCVDTIYNNHKTVDHSVFHLYHPTIGLGIHRQWIGQIQRMPFAALGARYLAAYGDRARMLRLNTEWRNLNP